MISTPARWLLVTLGAAFYGLPFVEPMLAPLAFAGLAPLLVVFGLGRERVSRASVLGFAAFAAYIGAALIALPVQRIGWVAMHVLMSFIAPWAFLGLAGFAWLRRRTGAPVWLLWPFVWIVAEWGWSYYSVGRVAFGLTGYTQFVFPRFIQIADLAGVLGVSFVIQLVVGALAEAGLAVLEQGRAGLLRRRAWGGLAVAAAAVLSCLVYGTFRLSGAAAEPGPRVALVQPAIEHGLSPQVIRRVQYKQMGVAREQIRPGEADLIVFPENAILTFIEDSEYLSEFQDLARELEASVLVGANSLQDSDLERHRKGLTPDPLAIGLRVFYRVHNSAVLVDAEGIRDKYDKIHLLAFTEQVPLEGLFASLGLLDGYRGFIVGMLGYIGTAVPGDQLNLLRIPAGGTVPVWVPICFEQSDGRLAREAALKGARALINITSEGQLGPQIYWNTLGVSVLRAAELKVGVARCGNMGISAIIDPWGRQTHLLRGRRGSLWGDDGVLKAPLPLGPGTPTLYARLGDWMVGLAVLVLLGAVVASRRRPGVARPLG